MHTQKNWFKVALMTLAVFGLTTGAFTLAAQARDNKDDLKFDHYACYEVEERDDKDDDDKKDHDKQEHEEVILFNQFEGGTKVRVGELELLCVPTHKEHRKDDGPKDDKK
jgi:hypothetical protein